MTISIWLQTNKADQIKETSLYKNDFSTDKTADIIRRFVCFEQMNNHIETLICIILQFSKKRLTKKIRYDRIIKLTDKQDSKTCQTSRPES